MEEEVVTWVGPAQLFLAARWAVDLETFLQRHLTRFAKARLSSISTSGIAFYHWLAA